MPSNKKFAYNFSIIFLIIALILLYLKIFDLFYLFLFLSVLFLIGGKLKPKLFKYLNYGWNKFALILHHIISPVIIFLIFFTIITPFGVLGRFFSSDLKKIKGLEIGKSSNFFDYENKTNYDNQF